MNRWRLLCVATVVSTSQLSFAAELAEADKETTTEAVNAFCDCAGFYLAGARLAEGAQQVGTAEKMKGLARGAEFAAKYLLAHEYAATHT
jgi:hypothetical protein